MSRILIVEDSPTQAEALRLVLTGEGFDVVSATDGHDAMNCFQDSEFDLVISDIVMPGRSGYELCSSIKGDPRGRNLPVMLLSTLSDPMDIVRGLECGADNFITKPYDPERLIARITTMLQNKRLRALSKLSVGVEVSFLDKTFRITSDKEQMLDLLMSTFEDIVRTNRSLEESKAELAAAKAKIEEHALELESRIEERTAALRERQEELARAQSIARLGSWRWDIRTDTVVWSGEMSEIFGVNRSFVPTLQSVLAMVHPEDRPAVSTIITVPHAQAGSTGLEFRIIRPDGETRHVWSDSNGEIEGGEMIALFGICQDVTRLKVAEISARENSDRYQNLVESSPDGIVVQSKGKIVFLNNSALKLLGAEHEAELIGRSVLEFFRSDHRRGIEESLQKLSGEAIGMPATEAKLVRSDGSSLDVEILGASLSYQGNLAAHVIIRNITESKKIEMQLHQAQKMEAVGQLTGGLAHDFNNLLSVMIGNLDLLMDHLAENSEARTIAERALTASLRGAELNHKLLAFSRRQPLNPQALDLNSIVRETTALLRRTLGEEIEISTNLDPMLWRATADATQIESALTNLAINARDAMPNGGRLTIETANQTLDSAYAAENVEVRPGEYVMLAVTDTGTGIPSDILPLVFEPFFTSKEVDKGTGLGLSMVYGFAKQSDGHVKIYSEEGHGTTVRVYLPRAGLPDVSAPETTSQGEVYGRGDEVILVVEDNAQVRATAAQQLTSLGYRVLEAANGPAALEVLAENSTVDLLFTDIVMPGGLSGVDLARQAQEIHLDLKVLYTSGFADVSTRRSGNSDTRINLLSKPYRKLDLAKKIREAIERIEW